MITFSSICEQIYNFFVCKPKPKKSVPVHIDGSDTDSEKFNHAELQRRIRYQKNKEKKREAKRLKIEQERNMIHQRIRRELTNPNGFPKNCIEYDPIHSNDSKSIYRCIIYHDSIRKRRNSR